MEMSVAKDFGKADRYEGRKIHRLWRELEQGMFPFMMNEVGVLTEKNRLLVSVCEAVVEPESFAYAKWKGVGRHAPALLVQGERPRRRLPPLTRYDLAHKTARQLTF